MSATETGDETTTAGRGRGQVALIALVVGLLLGVLLFIIWQGNPLSSANEIRYTTVTVGSVSDQQDSLCWSADPADRDATRECAILAIDPQAEVPQVGDTVTIGLVEIDPPDADPRTQIVFAEPATIEAGDDATSAAG